jgi:hypothetical protein
VVALAYTAYGLTGFGSVVIALPLLAHLFTLKFAVPLLMLLDLGAFLVLGASARRSVRYDVVGWLTPFMLAGMAVGLTLLIRVPERFLILALGAFLLAYASWGLSRRGPPTALARAWCAPIGLVGGALSGLFGTGGVLFAIYNAGRIRDKAQLRATNAAMIMFSSLLRLFLFGAAGLLAQEGLMLAALGLLPALFAGFWIGNRLHHAVPAEAVVRVLYALLILAGTALLARSLW